LGHIKFSPKPQNILGLSISIIANRRIMKNMPAAFVLINAEIGSEEEVLKELNKVEGVTEAYIVYGVYDIVAKIKSDTMDKLKDVVTWNVRRLNKVRSTLTMIIVEGAK
jgi:DNA-binding Lrp family transcriptional regulator